MVFFFALVFWCLFATNVNSLPQNEIVYSPTDITDSTNDFVDGVSVASAATVSPGTDVVINPPDTTEETYHLPEDNDSSGDTQTVIPDFNGSFQKRNINCFSRLSQISIGQPCVSSDLIASIESENNSPCNPDTSSQKRRQLIALKHSIPDEQLLCVPRKEPDPTPVFQDQTSKCNGKEGFEEFCCALAGAVLPDTYSGYVKREFCISSKNILNMFFGSQDSRLTINL